MIYDYKQRYWYGTDILLCTGLFQEWIRARYHNQIKKTMRVLW